MCHGHLNPEPHDAPVLFNHRTMRKLNEQEELYLNVSYTVLMTKRCMACSPAFLIPSNV